MAILATKQSIELMLSNESQLKDGRWVIGKPLPWRPLKWRIRDAFLVLMGKAEAVVYEED